MRVLFAGTPEVALPALNAIAASEHELVGVLTRPDAPSGRGRKLQPSPVAAIGHELGVPVFTPAHPKDPEFQQQLTDLAPDCCPVVAYGALLPSSVLQIPKHGWINLHFSLLPHWRGAAPVQHAIWAGDDFTGATTFQIVPELDAGPVFGVLTEKIQSTDTTGELLTRLSVAGAELLVATLSGVASGDLVAVPQPEAEISYAAKISAADAQIDWTLPGFAVDRQIRAMTPAPGAWTNWLVGNELERIKIGPVHLLPSSDLAAGAVQINKNSITVGTANLDVQLSWVQAKGKKQMAATDWARGLRTVGELRFW